MTRLLFVLVVMFSPSIASSQTDYEAEFQEQYEINIKLDRINDVYIPIDIDDAMVEMDRLSNEEGRAKMLEAPEELVRKRLVFGLGKWMISNWNFYAGSRLSHYLKEQGVAHPDDMAEYLIVTYYRKHKGIPLELEQRAKVIFEKRKKEQEKRRTKSSGL